MTDETQIEETEAERRERTGKELVELVTGAGNVPTPISIAEAAIRRGARFKNAEAREKFAEARPTSPILEDDDLSRAANEED